MFTDESWRSKMQGASAAIDDRFGEEFVIAPTIRLPNYPPQPSPSNPPYRVWGVFSYRSEQVFGHDPHTRAKGGAIVQSRKPIVSVSHLALPVAPCAGDVITRCADGSKFEIETVEPDGVSRITFQLTERGLQSP